MIERVIDRIEYLLVRPFDYILAAFLRLIFRDLK